eukprot:Skav215241  [mRNA]  locus=scaffold811:68130:69437:- [translate_table: standard]
MSWLEAWHHLKSPSMWLPLCVVQTQCLACIKGGASSVMKEILKQCLDADMCTGFQLLGGPFFRQSNRAYFLGDHDAVRQIFSFKGSSGLRPCTLCANVLKSQSRLTEIDDWFVELDAATGFQVNTDQQIYNQCDRLASCRTKAELEMMEKCSGLTYDADALMFDAVQRVKMPPSRIIYDYMHTYLCNGVASWEVCLFLEALFAHTDLRLDDLRQSIADDSWKRAGAYPSYIKNLLRPRLLGEGLYKGQAHQTRAVLPLLRYYVAKVVGPSGHLPQGFLDSFFCVCKIDCLVRRMQQSLFSIPAQDLRQLDELQKQHQALFKIYGVEHKPKHHHRMHFPQMFANIGTLISCEPLESKHQLYKAGVGDRQRALVKDFAAFSSSVLPRLLKLSAEILARQGLRFWQLTGKITDGTLDDKIFFSSPVVKTSLSYLDSIR